MPLTDEVAWNALNAWAFKVIQEFEIPNSYDEIVARMDKLSPGARGIAGVKWTDAEVWNGGFEQLFVNGGGCWAAASIDGFRLLEREDFAGIVSAAVDVFPTMRLSFMRDEAEDFLAGSKEAFERLDRLSQDFWDLERSQSMGPNILRYAHEHVIDDGSIV